MAEILGHLCYLEINMGTTAVASWKRMQNESNVTIDRTIDKIDVTSKSTGDYKKYMKGLATATCKVECIDDLAPGTNFLSYKDIVTIATKSGTTVGGTAGNGTGGGFFDMRITSATSGMLIEAFSAMVENLSKPMPNQDKISYSFGLQINGAITTSTAV
jgi:hypothetical protein